MCIYIHPNVCIYAIYKPVCTYKRTVILTYSTGQDPLEEQQLAPVARAEVEPEMASGLQAPQPVVMPVEAAARPLMSELKRKAPVDLDAEAGSDDVRMLTPKPKLTSASSTLLKGHGFVSHP